MKGYKLINKRSCDGCAFSKDWDLCSKAQKTGKKWEREERCYAGKHWVKKEEEK